MEKRYVAQAGNSASTTISRPVRKALSTTGAWPNSWILLNVHETPKPKKHKPKTRPAKNARRDPALITLAYNRSGQTSVSNQYENGENPPTRNAPAIAAMAILTPLNVTKIKAGFSGLRQINAACEEKHSASAIFSDRHE